MSASRSPQGEALGNSHYELIRTGGGGGVGLEDIAPAENYQALFGHHVNHLLGVFGL